MEISNKIHLMDIITKDEIIKKKYYTQHFIQ